MVDAGELRVKLLLDRMQFDSAMQGFHRKLRETRSLGKELGVEFDRIGRVVKGLGVAAAAAGASIVGMITGPLLMSPQFKEFMSRLKKPWFELSNFIGQTFKPSLDAVGRKFQEFVDAVRGSPEARDFLSKLNETFKSLVDSVSKEDMKRFIDFVSEVGGKTIDVTVKVTREIIDVAKPVVEAVESLREGYNKVIKEAQEGEPNDLVKAIQQYHNMAEWMMWGEQGKFYPGYGYLGPDDYFNPDYEKYRKMPQEVWYPDWGNPEMIESLTPKGPQTTQVNITINDPSGTIQWLGNGQVDLS